jgi:benzoate-CoA ligase
MSRIAPPSERFNFTRHILALNEHRSEATAYIDDHEVLPYGELGSRVRRFASTLGRLGLRREQRVLLLLHDRTEWPVAFLAIMYAGLIPVPVNTLLTADDYAYLLDHSEAAAIVVGAELLATLLSAQERATSTALESIILVGSESPGPSTSPTLVSFTELLSRGDDHYLGADTHRDSAAFWLYSSGSTGRPKGVVHTHASLYWTAELYAKPIMALQESDRVFSAAKLFFAYGLGNALTFPLTVGASVVLMSERPTPASVLTRLCEHGATVFCGAPTLYASLLASTPSNKPTTLRLCTSAGEALPAEIGAKFAREFGADILDGLGSTEMLHIFLSNRPSDISYGTTGRPVEGYEIQLRDEEGRVLGDDQIGDLWVKGPSSALLYWNDRAKTQSTFHGDWLRTGDKYVRRADGCYVYAGRNDDMLKISGQYVSPFEVESTLLQHPSVLESAVIAVADQSGISKCKAYVVLRQGHPASESVADELRAFVKTRLAPFKRPHHVEFVPELPKTATGKIQRYRLREQSRLSQPL